MADDFVPFRVLVCGPFVFQRLCCSIPAHHFCLCRISQPVALSEIYFVSACSLSRCYEIAGITGREWNRPQTLSDPLVSGRAEFWAGIVDLPLSKVPMKMIEKGLAA